MRLSETKIRHAKPTASAYKIFDGDGLYLEVTAAGGKHWRLKYVFLGKERKLALPIECAEGRGRSEVVGV